ncbi:MAG TPA: 50S ribosomal protein L21 [Stellaceae bacterium]|jgi:large subunit ribosomal protein L21
MFAVIRTGGKQYKVAKDDVITVERLAGEPGSAVDFAEVLMLADGAAVTAGTPLVSGASVGATIVEQSRAPKIIVFKKKRRQNYRRKKGHRQLQTVLRVTAISTGQAATEAAPSSEEGEQNGP